MSQVTDQALLARIDRLQASYAGALDRLDMQAWLATFSREGKYELNSLENVKLGLPVGMMLDDCHERLQDRIRYVNEVWAQAVEHYQPRHLLYRVGCDPEQGGGYRVTTNFSVFHTNAEGKSDLLVVGHYDDLVVEQDDELRFASKRAIMDTAVPPRYLIYPI